MAVKKKRAVKKSSLKKTTRKKAPRKKAASSGGVTSSTPSAGGTTPTGRGAGIRIRMYRVGFGDFFLMSLPGADGSPLHILIDCGVHAMDLGSIGDAIADMEKETGGNLALVVMTHRHADHISGFASGSGVFAKFNVECIWMSWFEDPNNADAVNFQATLAAVAENLQATLPSFGPVPAEYDQFRYMAENATGGLAPVGGLTGNAAALAVLHGGFANKVTPDYYQAGDTPVLPDSLVKAGLTAVILGPPIDPDLVAEMNGAGHQYLAANSDDSAVPRRFSHAYDATAAAYPPEAFRMFSAATIASNVASNQPDLLAAKAAQVDNTINNQSLVILFSFKGKTLLFAGDAQWGNWQNFLFGGALGTAGHDGLTSDAKAILGKIDFYKVGHHGSTNATPIDALNAMRPDCVAMCSTQPGAYGSIKNKSEVPRGPLIDALETKTDQQLARSDQVMVPGANAPAVLKKIQGLPAPGPLPSIFIPGPENELYIDFKL